MKIGLVFAGQGSQYVSMGQEFYDNYDTVKAIYDNVTLDFDIKTLCFKGPTTTLNDTAYAQPCILLTSSAIASLIKEHNINISYLCGLSLGEYSALVYSDCLSLQDGLDIVRYRGQIMSEALNPETSGMYAVLNVDINVIEAYCQQTGCYVANYNCPGQTVVSGYKENLDRFIQLLQDNNYRKPIALNVSGAFHTPLLEDASNKLVTYLSKYNFDEPNIPIIFNINAKEECSDLINNLGSQIKSSVYFHQSIEYMIANDVDTIIEVGPGNVLSKFIRKINRDIKVYSIDSVQSFIEMLGEINNGT